MRDIIFRGKHVDTGEWVEGFYVNCHGPDCSPNETKHYIVAYPGTWHEIYTSTIGQYTGLTDKSGKRIFEGDILNREVTTRTRRIEVAVFHQGSFDAFHDGVYHALVDAVVGGCEVIGNVHDNPELLK